MHKTEQVFTNLLARYPGTVRLLFVALMVVVVVMSVIGVSHPAHAEGILHQDIVTPPKPGSFSLPAAVGKIASNIFGVLLYILGVAAAVVFLWNGIALLIAMVGTRNGDTLRKRALFMVISAILGGLSITGALAIFNATGALTNSIFG